MRARKVELEDEGTVRAKIDISRRHTHGVSLKPVLLEDAMQVRLFSDQRAIRAGSHR